MKEQLNTVPQFVRGVWVTGTLAQKDEFVGRTCMFTNGHPGIVVVKKLGEVDNSRLESIKSYREISFPLTVTDSKLEFRKKMWVAGVYNKQWFIGVTCIRDQREFIALVNQSCLTNHIPFECGRNLKELFLSDQETAHSITRSNYDKAKISISDKLKGEITLSSIINEN